MNNRIHMFPHSQAVAHAAAQDFTLRSQQAVKKRGFFTVCLSGGSTPKALLSLLKKPPYCQLIPWRNILLFWGDERCVPLCHPKSNYAMAYRYLIHHVPLLKHHLYPIITEKLQPNQAAVRYQHQLQSIFKYLGYDTPKFDLIYLGMGNDGHTASLFPNNPLLCNQQQTWVSSSWVRQIRSHRITLMPQTIFKARAVIFLVCGSGKAAVLRRVLQGPNQGWALPAQAIGLGECQKNSIWLIDAPAGRYIYHTTELKVERENDFLAL